MPKNKKLAKNRLDKYYWLAKEQGFRSRAAYKLIQLNEKFNFLNNSKCTIDLCSAPGGWLQVCKKLMPLNSILIGIDLIPVKSISGVINIVGDITKKKSKIEISQNLNNWKADLILNDGSPNISGAWSKDSYSQLELSLYALKLAISFLKTGGTFVTKVFRCKDYISFLTKCKEFFFKVHATKPHSSRNVSAEAYLICQNFIPPKKNKSMNLSLTPSAVFNDNIENNSNKTSKGLFSGKQKPNKEGYEGKFKTLLERKESVMNFMKTDNPHEFLKNNQKLEFRDSDFLLNYKEETNEDIKHLCDDIKILNKRDLKILLKWRLAVRKKMIKNNLIGTCDSKIISNNKPTQNDKSESYEESLLAKLEKHNKQQRRKMHKAKMKHLRNLENSNIPDENEYVFENEDELFSLKSISKNVEIDKTKEWFSNGIFEDFEKYQKVFEEAQPYRKAKQIANKSIAKIRKKRLKYESKINEKKKIIEEIKEVPVQESDVSSDSEAVGETLAIGKAMLNKTRKKEILDKAYTSKLFNDHNDLPDWFVEEEKKYNRAPKFVNRQEINDMKEKVKKINVRPIKKIIEAVARKKLRKAKKMEKSKIEATKILESKNMSNRQKSLELEKIRKKFSKNKRPDACYIVSKKNGTSYTSRSSNKHKNSRRKLVDRRMKADKRRHFKRKGNKGLNRGRKTLKRRKNKRG